MKTLALASLFLITGIVGAALICFIVADARARSAEQELLVFKAKVQDAAQKRRLYPISPSGYVVSMVPATIPRSDRAQIDALQQRHERLLYRRALADWIFTRGMMTAVAVLGTVWFLARPRPPAPTRGLGSL